MKKLVILISLITVGLAGCTLTDKAKNLKFRKNCDGTESNKTLADTFCKKAE